MTFKIGVERTKLVECFSLEKKKAKKYHCRKSQKTVYGLQKKRGVELEKEEDEEYSAPTKLTQSMRLQSELCSQRLSFIYHWPGNSLPAEHFIRAIYWKKVARFQFSSWVCSQSHGAGDGCTMYGYCQAASRRECNGCRQKPSTTQTKGHQVHGIVISWDTQITPENCPLSDE